MGTFSSFSQNFCCILKVRWLFPNQMFITQNAFKLLLIDEDTKCSIFYAAGVIVYINPGRGRGGRDGMVVCFITTWSNQCISPTNLVRSIPAHGDVYSIQHLVIEFIKNMRQVGSYSSFLHQ
jgi:hypothetical protein